MDGENHTFPKDYRKETHCSLLLFVIRITYNQTKPFFHTLK